MMGLYLLKQKKIGSIIYGCQKQLALMEGDVFKRKQQVKVVMLHLKC